MTVITLYSSMKTDVKQMSIENLPYPFLIFGLLKRFLKPRFISDVCFGLSRSLRHPGCEWDLGIIDLEWDLVSAGADSSRWYTGFFTVLVVTTVVSEMNKKKILLNDWYLSKSEQCTPYSLQTCRKEGRNNWLSKCGRN